MVYTGQSRKCFKKKPTNVEGSNTAFATLESNLTMIVLMSHTINLELPPSCSPSCGNKNHKLLTNESIQEHSGCLTLFTVYCVCVCTRVHQFVYQVPN